MNKLMLALVLIISVLFTNAFALSGTGSKITTNNFYEGMGGIGMDTDIMVSAKSNNTVTASSTNARVTVDTNANFTEGTDGYILDMGVAIIPAYINGKRQFIFTGNKKGGVLLKKGIKMTGKYQSPSTSIT